MPKKNSSSTTEAAPPISPLTAGCLLLDVNARVLRKNGSTFVLRPKETALLRTFMSNCGQILTRKSLMKEVWETDYVDDTRTLEVHVCWLRKIIEDDPSRPVFLHTVRGIGYCFDPNSRPIGKPDEAN